MTENGRSPPIVIAATLVVIVANKAVHCDPKGCPAHNHRPDSAPFGRR